MTLAQSFIVFFILPALNLFLLLVIARIIFSWLRVGPVPNPDFLHYTMVIMVYWHEGLCHAWISIDLPVKSPYPLRRWFRPFSM